MPKSKILYLLLYPIMCLIFMSSCDFAKESEAKQILKDWTGRRILFPDQISFSKDGRDTLCPDIMNKTYKILLYVDTVGCTDCRLILFQWKKLIDEAAKIAPGKVGFIFLIFPKDRKELYTLFEKYKIKIPILIDSTDAVNRSNHFPRNPIYQCFLLNEKFEVLSVGNPAVNLAIWELYKQIILQEASPKPPMLTSGHIEPAELDFGSISMGKVKKGYFQLTNTGNNPLIIRNVSTSCGCTSIKYDEAPIKSGGIAKITVSMKPNSPGYFHKSLTIYCNTVEDPYQLTLVGEAIE